MFSGFKNIVSSSLQELERLGELSNLQQQQQLQRERDEREKNSQFQQPFAGTYFPGGGLGGTGRTQSESVLPQSPSISSQTFQRSSSPATGSSSGPSAITNADVVDAEATPVPGPGAEARRASNDGFTSFGLSGLKRSLGNLPRTTLDLGSLRTSYESSGRPYHSQSLSLDLTPSRDGRELGEWPLSAPNSTFSPPLSINTNTGSRPSRPKRRISARSASLSNLSGPYTPNTMMKMDPFFFVTLQGLPDELKQAAFTPLPTEDDDELLEQLDAEFSPSASRTSFPLPLPIPRSNSSNHPFPSTSLLSRSLPTSTSFRPSSDIGNGPVHPFLSPSGIRSPLADENRARLLERVLDAHEEEVDAAIAAATTEESENHPFVQISTSHQEAPYQHTNDELSSTSSLPPIDDMSDVARRKSVDDAKAVHLEETSLSAPETQDEPSSLTLATEAAILPHAAKEVSMTTLEENVPADAPLQNPITLIAPTPIKPTRAASIPKSESLAARLARISRAASPKPPEDVPSSPVILGAASDAAISIANVDKAAAHNNSEDFESAYNRLQAEKVSVDKLLQQYTSLISIGNVEAFETFLKARAAPSTNIAPTWPGVKELEETKKQLDNEKTRTASLEAEIRDSKASTTRAETRAKDEEEKKAKSISLLKYVFKITYRLSHDAELDTFC